MGEESSYYRLIEYKISDEALQPSPRRSFLHVPSTYDSAKPSSLIIALHGKKQPPTEFANHTRFPSFGFDGLVVFPEGINFQWTGDPEAPPRKEIDDVGFINILIDHLTKDYSIDTKNVFVVGFSNGGGLAGLLACDPMASARIVAFAMASGAFYKDEALPEPLFSKCHPSCLPVPMLELHGDSDPVIHYDGDTTPDGPTYNPLEYMKDWGKRNGAEEPRKVELYDGKVERYYWPHRLSNYAGEVNVHYKLHGFGHGWPSTYTLNNDEQRHGPTCFNATPVVLQFFKERSRT